MTSVEEHFRGLAEASLGARVNAASSLPVFVRALLREHVFIELCEALRSGGEGQLAALLELIRHTAVNQPIDPRFESPYDVQLAGALLALAAVAPTAARTASTMVSQAPGVWWARRLSEDLNTHGHALVSIATPDRWTDPVAMQFKELLHLVPYSTTAHSAAKTTIVSVAAAAVFALSFSGVANAETIASGSGQLIGRWYDPPLDVSTSSSAIEAFND